MTRSPDPSTEARAASRTTAQIEENARWAITKLGAGSMDGISAVNFAYDVLALAARLSQTEEALRPLREVSARGTPGEWWFDGRDIFTRGPVGATGHHLVLPLPDTWHESQRVGAADAELIVASVNAVRAALAASSAGETGDA